MDNEHEALARVLYEGALSSRSFYQLPHDVQMQYRHEADRAIAAGWRKMDATATKREWPVTEKMALVFRDAFNAYDGGITESDVAGLRAAAPFLWRARVEQATERELVAFLLNLPGLDTLDDCEVVRAALLAMGDL